MSSEPRFFPSIVTDHADNPWIIYCEGDISQPMEMVVEHSLDCGETWELAETIPGGPYTGSWMLPTIDAGPDGVIHAQFKGDDINVYYSGRNPDTETWSSGEVAAYSENTSSLDCASIVVDSSGEVHMAGLQTFGWGSNYGHIGVVKYWHGTSGDWSVPDAPFCEGTAWEDSFASWPSLGISADDALHMVFARIDTVIEQAAVSGLFYSAMLAGSNEWKPQRNLLEIDYYDCLYPQLVMRFSTEGSIPGPSIAWSEMMMATQPSAMYYMWLGEEDDLPAVTVEAFDTPLLVKKGTTAEWQLWVVNNTSQVQSVDFWLSVESEDLPDPHEVVLTEDIMIPANFEGVGTVRLHVPGVAPPGDYAVANRCGDYPGDPMDHSSFIARMVD